MKRKDQTRRWSPGDGGKYLRPRDIASGLSPGLTEGSIPRLSSPPSPFSSLGEGEGVGEDPVWRVVNHRLEGVSKLDKRLPDNA